MEDIVEEDIEINGKGAAKNRVPDMFRVLAVNRVLVALKYVSLFAGARAGDEVTRDHGPVPLQPRGTHALYLPPFFLSPDN